MIEEKLDLLTKETVALRKAVEANTAALGATGGAPKKAAAASDDSGEDAPKKGRGRPKKEEVAPEHDKDEVDAIIRRVSKEVGKPVAKKIISDQGADDLADLLTMPAKYDAAFAAAEAALEPEEGDEAEEEDDI